MRELCDRSVHFALAASLFGVIVIAWQATASCDETQPADEEKFTSIFNGRDLTGWTGDTKKWAVENGVLACQHGARNLFTDREYADFILRFEFRLAKGANNGIGLRTPLGSKWVSTEGIEIQILDEGVAEHRDLKPYQFHGSIYGVVAAERGALKPIAEWNDQEISCVRRSVRITVNGKKVLEANLDDYEVDPAPDGIQRLGLKRSKGHLALLGHSQRAEFRNLRVREMDGAKASSP